MAVISCPNCNKKISDKAKNCSHCQLDMENLDADKLRSIANTNIIKKSQSIMTYSFIAMLLFCGGFLFLYWTNAQAGSWQYVASTAVTIIGFIAYIATRIQLILLKRRSK